MRIGRAGVFFACVAFLSIAACAGPRLDGDGEGLEAAARSMASDRGLSVWRLVVSDRFYQNREGERFKDIYIYSDPRSIGRNLCKSVTYAFHAFDHAGTIRRELIDIIGLGYSTMYAAVVRDVETEPCDQLPLDRYFNMHEPIEDATLVELYRSLMNALALDPPVGQGRQDFKITRIALFPRFGGGYRYNVKGESAATKQRFSLEVELESATFRVRKVFPAAMH